MSNTLRKVVRRLAVGLAAAIPLAMAPCESSLQYPPDNTQTFWGIALALPKVDGPAADSAGLEATEPVIATDDAARSCK